MPKNERHGSQKKKNLALLGVLLVLIILIYAITVMRIHAGIHAN